MRAALIILPEYGTDAMQVAGRSVARHQLEFALASGSRTIIMQGNPASAEALDLRQRAEAADARVAVIGDALALSGLLSPSDDLLVLQQNLLPVAREAPALVEGEPHILVLPGDVARPGSFERIDLQRAWGGAMVVPGGLVERLHDLGEGLDGPSSLLRLALQYGLKERAVPPEWLDGGSWTIATPDKVQDLSQRWLDRALRPVTALAPAKWLGRLIARVAAPRLAGNRQSAWGIAALTALLATGAGALAWYDYDWPAFLLGGLSAVSAWTAIAVQRLLSMPFGTGGRISLVRWLPDIALFAIAIMSIEGSWNERLFPPLVLFAGLRWLEGPDTPRWMRLLRDRLVLAGTMAAMAGVGLQEKGVMLAALLALLPSLSLAQSKTRITRN